MMPSLPSPIVQVSSSLTGYLSVHFQCTQVFSSFLVNEYWRGSPDAQHCAAKVNRFMVLHNVPGGPSSFVTGTASSSSASPVPRQEIRWLHGYPKPFEHRSIVWELCGSLLILLVDGRTAGYIGNPVIILGIIMFSHFPYHPVREWECSLQWTLKQCGKHVARYSTMFFRVKICKSTELCDGCPNALKFSKWRLETKPINISQVRFVWE